MNSSTSSTMTAKIEQAQLAERPEAAEPLGERIEDEHRRHRAIDRRDAAENPPCSLAHLPFRCSASTESRHAGCRTTIAEWPARTRPAPEPRMMLSMVRANFPAGCAWARNKARLKEKLSLRVKQKSYRNCRLLACVPYFLALFRIHSGLPPLRARLGRLLQEAPFRLVDLRELLQELGHRIPFAFLV